MMTIALSSAVEGRCLSRVYFVDSFITQLEQLVTEHDRRKRVVVDVVDQNVRKKGTRQPDVDVM